MIKIHTFLSFFLLLLPSAYGFSQNFPVLDKKQIENLTGAIGDFDQETNTFKVFAPTANLKVNALGVKLTPAFGLTSWVSFKSQGSNTYVVGELVLLEQQVNLIMQEAMDYNLNITALFNALLWDSPKIMCMRIEGEGSTKELATAIGKIFETIKTTTNGSMWKNNLFFINPDKSTLTLKNLEEVLGKKGIFKNGVYKVIWDNPISLQEQDTEKEAYVIFAGTDKEAVILGKLSVKKDQVQNILKTLLKNKIFITSLHQQRNERSLPSMVVRFIGRGPALELAKTLKETVEQAGLSFQEDQLGKKVVKIQ